MMHGLVLACKKQPVAGLPILGFEEPTTHRMACLIADEQFSLLDVPFEEHPQGRCTAIPAVDEMQEIEYQTRKMGKGTHEQKANLVKGQGRSFILELDA